MSTEKEQKERVKLAQENIPEGWIQVKEGRVIVGDRLWLWSSENFSDPCEEDSILIRGKVEEKWCVIRKRSKPPLTVDDSKTSISKLVRVATKR